MNTKRLHLPVALALIALAFGTLQATVVRAEGPHIDLVWTSGHADGFYVSPHGDHLHLEFHDDGAGSLNPAEVLVLARADRMTSNTSVKAILGATDDVWLLPASPTTESPGYDWVGMAGWTNATLTLESVSVPDGGRFALFYVDGAFEVQVPWDSATATPQPYNTGAPAHGHVNWAFSSEGLYTLQVRASATDPGSAVVQSGSRTYYACVTSEANPSPEEVETACGVDLHGDEPGPGPEPCNDCGSADVGIEVDIAAAGGLTISVAAGSTTLSSSGMEGGLLRYAGQLPNVTVVDQRPGTSNWTVNGIASAFASGSDTFGSNYLGWEPSVVSDDLTPGHTHAGGAVAPGPEATDGLAISRTLIESHGGGFGSAEVTAGLTLEVPASTPLGSYVSTLTLTVI